MIVIFLVNIFNVWIKMKMENKINFHTEMFSLLNDSIIQSSFIFSDIKYLKNNRKKTIDGQQSNYTNIENGILLRKKGIFQRQALLRYYH